MAIPGETNVTPRTVLATAFTESRRYGWWILGLVTLAVIAIVTLSTRTNEVTLSPRTSEAAAESVQVPAPVPASNGEPLLTVEELALVQLANTGHIPLQAVDWDTIELKRAVAKGLVPLQALQKARTESEPLFTAEELATIELAGRGLIPRQTVDWEAVELSRLANQGLIPRAAAP